MLIDARRFFSLSAVALLLSGCSGALGGTSTPSASSAQSDSTATSSGTDDVALSTRTAMAALDAAPMVTSPSRVVTRRLPIQPNANGPAFLIDFVEAGEALSGVPCIDCVDDATSGDNIGLTGPINYVAKGATWQYTLSFSVSKLNTTCKLAWAIAKGKTVIDSFAKSFKVKGTGGYVVYGINRPRPSYSGPAELTGKVTCGKAGSQTTQAPLYFQ
jgi:hypothetical protein